MGIPVESQRMIYKGKQLKDDKKLSDYGKEEKYLKLIKNSIQLKNFKYSHL